MNTSSDFIDYKKKYNLYKAKYVNLKKSMIGRNYTNCRSYWVPPYST